MFISYEKIIKEAAEEKKSQEIPNSSMDHAEIALRYLFNYAGDQATARIVSSTLYEEFWSRLKEIIRNFLKNGGKIETVLLDVGKDTKSPTLNSLKKEFAGQVEEYHAADSLKKISKEIPHFTTVGTKSYRFERSHEDMEKKMVKGFVNFNDEIVGNSLNILFDKLKKLSTPFNE
jgi:hypothetical protein